MATTIVSLFLTHALPLWLAVTGRWEPIHIVLLFWLETYLLLALDARSRSADKTEILRNGSMGSIPALTIFTFAISHLLVILFVVATGAEDRVITNSEFPGALRSLVSAITSIPFVIAAALMVAGLIITRRSGQGISRKHLVLRVIFINVILTIMAGPLYQIGFPAAAILGFKIVVDIVFLARNQR